MASKKAPLNRETVLATALRMADEGGVEALSMRKLGQALGVEAMSLYHHVRNKEEVIDGIVDLVFAEIDLPEDGEPWREAMRRRAVSARCTLLRHPWAASLMNARPNPGPATLRHHDAVIGSLRGNGFDLVLAAHAFSVIDSYLFGFALTQATLPFENEEQLAAVVQHILPRIPRDQYPHLHELTINHVMQPGYDYADEFAFGLELVLEGLERARG
ncbi:MAG: TetR/AcrR family transcriptional regulator C-terminal domain-containing protein [Planctomycetota bacterium]